MLVLEKRPVSRERSFIVQRRTHVVKKCDQEGLAALKGKHDQRRFKPSATAYDLINIQVAQAANRQGLV